jgi:hypothetical protein
LDLPDLPVRRRFRKTSHRWIAVATRASAPGVFSMSIIKSIAM